MDDATFPDDLQVALRRPCSVCQAGPTHATCRMCGGTGFRNEWWPIERFLSGVTAHLYRGLREGSTASRRENTEAPEEA